MSSMNSKDSFIMFKVGDLYVESASRSGVVLTTHRGKAIKIDCDAEYDLDSSLTEYSFAEYVFRRFNNIGESGLDVKIVRETIETTIKQCVDNVEFVMASNGKVKLAIERSVE